MKGIDKGKHLFQYNEQFSTLDSLIVVLVQHIEEDIGVFHDICIACEE